MQLACKDLLDQLEAKELQVAQAQQAQQVVKELVVVLDPQDHKDLQDHKVVLD